jgi:hypothetical protein
MEASKMAKIKTNGPHAGLALNLGAAAWADRRYMHPHLLVSPGLISVHLYRAQNSRPFGSDN